MTARITEADLELLKQELENITPANEPVAKVRAGIFALIAEVEELRRDWSYVATTLEMAEVRIEELRAALCELREFEEDDWLLLFQLLDYGYGGKSLKEIFMRVRAALGEKP